MSDVNPIVFATDSLVKEISKQFRNSFYTVDKYTNLSDKTRIPACLIEVDEQADIQDAGTGELDIDHRWNVILLTAPEKDNARENIIILSTQVAQFIASLERFAININKCEIVSIGEEHFKPNLKSYLAWNVEVSISIRDGYNSLYDLPEIPPGDRAVYYSQSPDIGLAHEDDYEEVSY